MLKILFVELGINGNEKKTDVSGRRILNSFALYYVCELNLI